ncbi:UPF0271 protein [Salsuginibacillus halophilus]|uniref:5-oxoprolinase subunit A n=1 Tax=Salsuginibacillus halophilus TaxID=517424 RepID=A0A2P8HI41_9BACI|nr:5-oxoprolinase subunit PxpA [Salsuginibacillus halophilus]PSL45879.1 UPF0271 protein [Salsuginibacillus halophilus]
MTKRIDLNSDLGESFGAYTIGRDAEVLELITSCNVACGYHAGDHNVMAATVEAALATNTAIGAHPGLPDLIGFGRRVMQTTPEDVYNFMVYQIGALQAFLNVQGATLHHVKPHGALYNMAAKDAELAASIAAAVKAAAPGAVLYGLAGSELVAAGRAHGVSTATEMFADRRYTAEGILVPRTEANAVIHDTSEAVQQVMQVVKHGTLTAVDGSQIALHADTICVHGDSEEAVAFAANLRRELEAQGITLLAPGKELNA